MARRIGSMNRDKHDTVMFLSRFVKRVRRMAQATGCQKCRQKRTKIMLGGVGLTLTELARKADGTLARLKKEIRDRGWVCRRCLDNEYGSGTAYKDDPRRQWYLDNLAEYLIMTPKQREPALKIARQVLTLDELRERVPDLGQ